MSKATFSRKKIYTCMGYDLATGSKDLFLHCSQKATTEWQRGSIQKGIYCGIHAEKLIEKKEAKDGELTAIRYID